jgi:hypothetical protein
VHLIAHFAKQDLEAMEEASFKLLFSGMFLTNWKPDDRFIRSSTSVDIYGHPHG